jgi:hypothetical protein
MARLSFWFFFLEAICKNKDAQITLADANGKERIELKVTADRAASIQICGCVPPENRPNSLSLPRCENF